MNDDELQYWKQKQTKEDEHGDPRSKVSGGNAKGVAEHYNRRKELGISGRFRSPIAPLKCANNWVKSVLIDLYIHPKKGAKVLDLCCGMGGDLLKWKAADVSYVFAADIAEESVRKGIERYNGFFRRRGNHSFSAQFAVGDCHLSNIPRFTPHGLRFDFISCQFAFHYCFESEERAKGMLKNISELLKSGGYFIATLPDANVLVQRLKKSHSYEFGNEYYNIRFEENSNHKKKGKFSKSQPYGIKYHFHLKDAVDYPEYLVHIPTLIKLASSYDLDLEFDKNFQYFFTQFINKNRYPSYHKLLGKIKVVRNISGPQTIDPEIWDTMGIYKAIAFKKRNTDPNPSSDYDWDAPEIQEISDHDIIYLDVSC